MFHGFQIDLGHVGIIRARENGEIQTYRNDPTTTKIARFLPGFETNIQRIVTRKVDSEIQNIDLHIYS